MPSPRKLALGAVAVLATLIVALIAVPLLFRDRIASRLEAAINASVFARVSWSGAGLSVFRDFPNVTLTVDDPTVVGVRPFEGDTLVTMRGARVALDLGSVIGYLSRGERIVVREIALDRPVARLRVLENGMANWDISRPTQGKASAGSRALGVTLRELRIEDGTLTLDDRKSNTQASVYGFDETLEGDFGEDRFTLSSRTRADSVSYRFAGVPYLSRVAIALDTDVEADMKAQKFTFRKDTLRLNALQLAFDGSVVTGQPNTTLDLTFSAPGTAFRDILSLVPAVYTKDFAQVQTTGTMAVSGRVRGDYGPKAFPSLALKARVENGTFKYPSLPLPARDIVLDLAVDNPGGHVDRTVIDLKRLHAAIGGRPLDARLVMRTPVSDPDVDLTLAGSLDLADLARTVKLENVSRLTGIVAADVAMRARVSDFDAGRFERVAARGTINLADVALQSKAVPYPVDVDTAALRLTPRTAELSTFAGRIGNSDLRATGALDNLLGYLLRDDELRGRAAIRSAQVDLNEWKSDEPTTDVIPVPPGIDFTLDATVDRVLYDKITATNVRGGLRVKDRRVTLDDLRMEMLKGSVIANGWYSTADTTTPAFDMKLEVATLDIPTAFAALNTVQKLAPVARWAQGGFSGTIDLEGTLDRQMAPVFTALSGDGTFETTRLALEGVPVLEKLADAIKIEQIRKPAIGALKATFAVADGRVAIRPFTVTVAGLGLTVGGTHGIDQTLSYDLGLAVPRSLLGGAANGAIARLAAQAGKSLADSASGDVVQLAAQVTGTVTNPTVKVDFKGLAASVREAAQTAIRQEVETRVDAVKAKADSAADAARERARAEAQRLVAEADSQAARIRAEARSLAEAAKKAASERADSLVAKATNPVAKVAARAAADRVKKEAEQQADRAVREADARAEALVRRARQQADSLAPPPKG